MNLLHYLSSIVRPTLTIVGEEGTKQSDIPTPEVPPNLELVPQTLPSYPITELTLYVDPLDGTSDYAHGDVRNVTVLIGVTHKGHPIAGVVHFPFVQNPDTKKDRVVWGVVGVGVFGLDPHPHPIDGRNHITVSGSFLGLSFDNFLQASTV